MGWFRRLVRCPRREAVAGLVFLAFFAVQARAQLGTPPIILVQPSNVSVSPGETAIISATVAPSLTPQNFHWFFNGQPVVTNADITASNTINLALDIINVLVVNNANSNSAGIYSLRITNGVGSAVSSNAALTVQSLTITNPIYFVTSGIGLNVNGFQIQLSGPIGSNFVIQASADLKNWVSISTNPAPTGIVSYVDTSAKTNVVRFYRAFIP
ncbi:MAG TPA: immunoglobulin domain-containing protein [Verrucomicrobiae bacterium]|nr:immunoglobulin domain-containing protein [Verrucomicrobiae bacterium]